MKAVEIISFEEISAIDQPILSLSMLKVSMKQLALLILAVLLSYSIIRISIELSLTLSATLLLIAFYKPYSMPFEELLVNATRFIMNRKVSKQDNARLYNEMRLFKKREEPKIRDNIIAVDNEQLLHYLTNAKDFHLTIDDKLVINAGESKIHLALKDNGKIVLEINNKSISKIDIL